MNGDALDVTKWIPIHPGGEQARVSEALQVLQVKQKNAGMNDIELLSAQLVQNQESSSVPLHGPLVFLSSGVQLVKWSGRNHLPCPF